MSDNNPPAAALTEAADVNVNFPHEKVFTAEEVAHVLAHADGSSNGGGAAAIAAAAPPPAGVATRLVSGRYEGTNGK
ncbi:MAG TPA: hypothetical protein VKB12_15745, partial [Pyrinomonadaceae bacterium]|nr:hypothetical protein [Pyrinomonadaceae bacterium]